MRGMGLPANATASTCARLGSAAPSVSRSSARASAPRPRCPPRTRSQGSAEHEKTSGERARRAGWAGRATCPSERLTRGTAPPTDGRASTAPGCESGWDADRAWAKGRLSSPRISHGGSLGGVVIGPRHWGVRAWPRVAVARHQGGHIHSSEAASAAGMAARATHSYPQSRRRSCRAAPQAPSPSSTREAAAATN
eukprot:scaffold28182_cov126-Isochrysis_galbana.AAC.2